MSATGTPGRAALLAVALALALARPAGAQAREDPAETARLRLGPFFLSPRLVIKEIGVDSNVFNDAVDPQQDFTATINPELILGLRAGWARLTAVSSTDYVYYNEFKTERSVNSRVDTRAEFFLHRLQSFVAAQFLDTRERPGHEIDARLSRSEPVYSAGVELRVGARTSIGVSARQQTTQFAAGQIFRGVDLARALNRKDQSANGVFKLALTPLTALSFAGEVHQSRFDVANIRDADSVRFAPTIELHPDALISGSLTVGYRRFDARGPGVPDFRGVVAAAELRYTLLGNTQILLRAGRDVAYSFEEREPYYLASGGGVTVTQRVYGPLDVQVGGTRQWNEYLLLAGVDLPARTDRIGAVTAGVGYRLAQGIRLGLNVELAERLTNVQRTEGYERVKIYGNLTYGF